MPLKIKEEPAIVDDVALAYDSKARLPAVWKTTVVKASALNDIIRLLLQEDLHGMRPQVPSASLHVGCRVAVPDAAARGQGRR
mmetsp:Transcript_24723/g.85297  ORF Transcript_24723/g.85297 Transcript_24723/m.85297 type:complete len:83 (-) Transcript_24723:291-539(-)